MIFSLLAVYQEPLQQVMEAWSKAFSLEIQPNSPETLEWYESNLQGVTNLLTFRKPGGYDCVWVEAHATRFESYQPAEKLFLDILALPLLATEVILLDDHYIGGPIVTNHWHDETVREVVEDIERQYHCREHSLRAYRLDTLRDVEEWRGQAGEFGLGWRELDDYAILDVHWQRRGMRETVVDSLTCLPLQHAFVPGLEDAMTAFPQGTVLMLKLTSVSPNPDRSQEPWRQVLQQVAESLKASLGPGEVLFRLDYPRQFGLLLPGLSKAAAETEMISRAESGRAARGADGYTVQAMAYSFSWPEDGKTPDELEGKLQEAFDQKPHLVEHSL